jgi:orotidine-5'-phosphate decarboxylase
MTNVSNFSIFSTIHDSSSQATQIAHLRAMTRQQLTDQIIAKRSFLCIGIDPDPAKLPPHISRDAEGVYRFCSQIIAATHHLCVAYKPNLAFFEAYGPRGMEVLAQLRTEMPQGVLTIADAKRGDIGNTSAMYAKAFFETMGFHAITLSPYMGKDSISPFLGMEGRWAVILALTSNPGANDFETRALADGEALYERVLRTSSTWGTPDDTMYVVGATRAEMLSRVRAIVPHHFLLVPGVGAQGGSLAEVARYGMNAQCGLLVNASRSIIYASAGTDFAEAARAEAHRMQAEMEALLAEHGVV